MNFNTVVIAGALIVGGAIGGLVVSHHNGNHIQEKNETHYHILVLSEDESIGREKLSRINDRIIEEIVGAGKKVSIYDYSRCVIYSTKIIEHKLITVNVTSPGGGRLSISVKLIHDGCVLGFRNLNTVPMPQFEATIEFIAERVTSMAK